MDGTPTLALLLLCHFERFRSAVVSSEPAAAQILEMSEMPDAVEPGRSVFGYCPFDLRHAGGPEPRRGLPNEPVRGTKKNTNIPLTRQNSRKKRTETPRCARRLSAVRCTHSVSQLASVATTSHFKSSVRCSTVKNVISNIGLFLGLPATCTRRTNAI